MHLVHFKDHVIIFTALLYFVFLDSHIFIFLILTEFAYFNMFSSNSETALARALICLYMFENAFYLHSCLIDGIAGLGI